MTRRPLICFLSLLTAVFCGYGADLWAFRSVTSGANPGTSLLVVWLSDSPVDAADAVHVTVERVEFLSTRTLPDGSHRLGPLALGSYDLVVTASEHAPHTVPGVVAGGPGSFAVDDIVLSSMGSGRRRSRRSGTTHTRMRQRLELGRSDHDGRPGLAGGPRLGARNAAEGSRLMLRVIALGYCGLIWLLFKKFELLPCNKTSQGLAALIGVATFSQSTVRHIKPGQRAEIAFASRPGEIIVAEVDAVVWGGGEAQIGQSGNLPKVDQLQPAQSVAVRFKLLDVEGFEPRMGASGSVAVYTDHGKAFSVIRKIMLRMQSLLNYLG